MKVAMLAHSTGRAVNRLLRPLGVEVKRIDNTDRLITMTARQVARLLYFQRRFDAIRGIEGDVVECGVGPGGDLLKFAVLIKEELKGRRLWGFDSFEGYPEPSPEDLRDGPRLAKGQWGGTSIIAIEQMFLAAGIDHAFMRAQVTLVKGFFQESLDMYRGSGIALLHLDVDLYDSYLTCLEMLYPKVVPGGVVMFGDYVDWTAPGAQKAIDRFFRGTSTRLERDTLFGKYHVVKREDGSGQATEPSR